MNLILEIPFGVRLLLLLLVGMGLGALVNLAIYRLAWRSRSISPWSRPHPQASPRRLADYLPLLGWLGLRREATLHGHGFWIRPMMLELATGIGLATLYWWEVGQRGLLPPGLPAQLPLQWQCWLHQQFVAHAVLILLMLAASIIDIDEKMIPDAITVPGTLLGLLATGIWPGALLPDVQLLPNGQPVWWPLWLSSPNAWPGCLGGFPHYGSLAIGLGCWWLWCVALMPRTWYPRHGMGRALQLCLARVTREPVSLRIAIMGLAGSAGIASLWLGGGWRWMGLLSGLVGMAAGGLLIWMVRLIGAAALKREAMGFGDVTLMAMIGALLGWQAALIIFFLAPFAGLAVGLLQWLLRRDNVIPYGPFLCLATVVVLVRWSALWDRLWSVFGFGWVVPLMVLACLPLFGLLLLIWQILRSLFR